MRINTILENTLRNSKLKRVRVKIDPAQLDMQDFHMIDSYEGYILEETPDTLKVYMLNLPDDFDPVQTVNRQHAEELPDTCDTSIIPKVLRQLEHEGVSCDNPYYQKIQNLHDAEFVDAYLRELGFDDKKLIEFYKKISFEPVYEGIADVLSKGEDIVAKTAAGARKFSSSPLFKAGETGAKALASIPGLLVGKNNIIGRFAKFMQTFDVNDLIKTSEKYDSKDPTKIKEGAQVFIKGLEGVMKRHHIDVDSHKIEGDTYSVTGVVRERVFTERAKSYDVTVVHPEVFNSYYNIKLSYPEIFNKAKKGQLVLTPRDTSTDPEVFSAIVNITPRYILIKAYEPTEELPAGNVERTTHEAPVDLGKVSLEQDKIRANVDKALQQFLGDRKLENLGLVANTISLNILQLDKNIKVGIETFDRTMIELLQDKIAAKSGNPLMYLKKYLGPVGLYKE